MSLVLRFVLIFVVLSVFPFVVSTFLVLGMFVTFVSLVTIRLVSVWLVDIGRLVLVAAAFANGMS